MALQEEGHGIVGVGEHTIPEELPPL